MNLRNYSNGTLAFNYLREQLESSGITVMQNGVVGANNYRKLNIDEFRGFLLYDDIAPIIFINNNDSLTGKIEVQKLVAVATIIIQLNLDMEIAF